MVICFKVVHNRYVSHPLHPETRSRLIPFNRRVPFPYSKNHPLVVGDSSSRESVPSTTSPTMAKDPQVHRISLPSERAAALAKYPHIAVSDVDSSAVFSRDSISAILGGNSKNHHVVWVFIQHPQIGMTYAPLHRLGPTATDFAKRHRITAFTMSTVERNPWSPIRPGQHGYWFLPALEMRAPFKVNDKRHVFTGTGDGPYHYCGYYRIAGFGKLTVDEWLSLTPLVRPQIFHALVFLTILCEHSIRANTSGASVPAPRSGSFTTRPAFRS